MKLFIGNLARTTDEARVTDFFRRGRIQLIGEPFIARNAELQSLRYGFVTVQDRDVDDIMKRLNGVFCNGEAIKISKPKFKRGAA